MIDSGWIVDAVLAFNDFVIFYFISLNTIYLMLLVLSIGAAMRFARETFFSDSQQILESDLTLPISIIVAARNEELTILETVRSLMRVNYREFEVIVVNDGSTDGTLETLVSAYGLRKVDRVAKRSLETQSIHAVYGSASQGNIILVDKEQGGKPDALNAAINFSRYPLICSIDADSVIEPDALLRVVKPFVTHPGETVAAGGIVRIINGCQIEDGVVKNVALSNRALPILQAVEYLRGFLAGRMGWDAIQSLLIISGAFGVYRKETVIRAGGYSGKTDSEDLELVVRMRRMLRAEKKSFRMAFVPDPVCWTEVPTKFGDLARQRSRWHRGLIQTLWSERKMLFNPRYGRVGLFVMPYFVLFEMLGPFVETLGYITILVSYIMGSLDREYLLLFLSVSVFYGVFLSAAAVLLEEVWFRRYPNWLDVLKLLVFSLIENLGYRQALSLFKIKAFWDLLLRRRGWGDIERIRFLPAEHDGKRSR